MDTYNFSKAVFKVVKNPDTRWKLKKELPQLFFHPFMKRDEYLLFEEISKGKKTVLEYGSGGSTIGFLKKKKKVFSVESNPDFYSFMTSIDLVKKSIGKNLHYKFIDLGPTNKWGNPLTNESDDCWPDYYKAIWDDIDPAREKIDMVFIDGRFRISCCLYTILKVVEYNWKDIVFVMHDFTKREQYKAILQFVEEIDSTRTLACFRLKENLDLEEVNNKLQEFALVTK